MLANYRRLMLVYFMDCADLQTSLFRHEDESLRERRLMLIAAMSRLRSRLGLWAGWTAAGSPADSYQSPCESSGSMVAWAAVVSAGVSLSSSGFAPGLSLAASVAACFS